MEKFLIIFAVCILTASLLVYLFFYWKKYRARKEVERQKEEARSRKRQELIEACEEGDIDKMIELLEKGVDPNQRIKVWVSEYDDEGLPPSVPPPYSDISYNPNIARHHLQSCSEKIAASLWS